jgi:hypothetical protein
MKLDTIKDVLPKYISEEMGNEIDQLESRLAASLTDLSESYRANDFYYIRQK